MTREPCRCRRGARVRFGLRVGRAIIMVCRPHLSTLICWRRSPPTGRRRWRGSPHWPPTSRRRDRLPRPIDLSTASSPARPRVAPPRVRTGNHSWTASTARPTIPPGLLVCSPVPTSHRSQGHLVPLRFRALGKQVCKPAGFTLPHHPRRDRAYSNGKGPSCSHQISDEPLGAATCGLGRVAYRPGEGLMSDVAELGFPPRPR